ncbi:unnamed protein product [Meloidogyne enterolobii]|uniref:Uncharacterized protein n=1 Tax=Meloidogyne enterolobii TaxID=390850 RepID=A0ACB1AYE3_MELEN
MELREEEDLDEEEMNLSTTGALSPMILTWTPEWEALVEEELKREYKEVILHQELLMDIPIGSPILPPPLKQEPLSVVFVGPEPGTQAAATNFIQNANNFDYSPPHQNPPQYAQQQSEQWIDGNFEENNTIWQQQENNEQQQYFNSEGHYQNYQQPYGTFTGEEEYMEDMGTSTIPTVSSTSPTASAFEPLSVCSSACTWSSGGGGEYSSSSQDEIYEEIQRECAEIERRSFSRSPQEKGSEKHSSKILEKLPHTERKKELNRVAATRYREKKRKEREEAVGEMAKLESRNLTLKSEIAAVRAEINYLKGLAKEIETVRRTKIIS